MFQFVADENFSGDIVRGSEHKDARFIVVRVQDIGFRGHDDPAILAWAAANGHIVLTHDRTTMPPFAWNRVVSGQPMPGVFVISDTMAIGQAIDEILVVVQCIQPRDCVDAVFFFPLA